MLLEQTYNADAKEESGLDGITQNEAACTKWVYTKAVTAAVSYQLKSMLHLNKETENPHHEASATRVTRDAALVLSVMEEVKSNPFTNATSHLINIFTGQHASPETQKQLTEVKQIGLMALSDALTSRQTKASAVKLQTFQGDRKKGKKKVSLGKSDEVAAFLE